MRSEFGSGGAPARLERGVTAPEASAATIAGVKWFGGEPVAETACGERCAMSGRGAATFVIGRAHGPRLLELLCAAG